MIVQDVRNQDRGGAVGDHELAETNNLITVVGLASRTLSKRSRNRREARADQNDQKSFRRLHLFTDHTSHRRCQSQQSARCRSPRDNQNAAGEYQDSKNREQRTQRRR